MRAGTDRIHFAGEHLEALAGYMESAVRSGKRAAAGLGRAARARRDLQFAPGLAPRGVVFLTSSWWGVVGGVRKGVGVDLACCFAEGTAGWWGAPSAGEWRRGGRVGSGPRCETRPGGSFLASAGWGGGFWAGYRLCGAAPPTSPLCLSALHPPFNSPTDLKDATAAQLRAFGKVPEVASFGIASGMFLQVAAVPNLTLVPEEDTRIGTVVDRPRVLAGRVANPNVADELAIDESIAAQLHLRVGGHLDVSSYSPKQVAIVIRGGRNPGPPAGPRVRLRIVGIVRRPFDLGRRGALGGVTILTPAFYHHYAGRIGTFGGMTVRVRTRNGLADIAQIRSAAQRIFGPSPNLAVTSVATEAGGAQDAINVLTIALWILAGVAAAAGAVAIGIVLTRQVSLASFDQETLRALGMTRSQRVAVSAPRAVLIAAGGALVAAVGAAATSSLFPIGVARLAEPDPGVRLDWPVLALGVAAVASAVLAFSFVAGLRSAQPDAVEADAPISRRTSAVAARAGLAPTATNGLRMALEPGRGRAAVPVRSAFVGVVLGVLGVTAVLVFASSLNHLITTPRLYGWTWDFSAPESISSANSCIRADFGLLKEPGVGALASVCAGTDNIQLDGRPTSGWSFSSLRGTIEPAVVAGRAPSGAREVALGSATMHTLRKHIGDMVQGAGPHGKRDYRIVGQVVLPSLGQIQPLADGAAFTGPGFAPLLDPNAYNGISSANSHPTPTAPRSNIGSQPTPSSTPPQLHLAPLRSTDSDESTGSPPRSPGSSPHSRSSPSATPSSPRFGAAAASSRSSRHSASNGDKSAQRSRGKQPPSQRSDSRSASRSGLSSAESCGVSLPTVSECRTAQRSPPSQSSSPSRARSHSST